MSLVILGIGLPGSGKTTVLKPLAEQLGGAYVCPDDIRAELSVDPADHTREEEVWDVARARAIKGIEARIPVIIDATFSRPDHRVRFIEILRAAGATHVIGGYADVPLRVAKERNAARDRIVSDEVIERRHALLTEHPPTLEDGFDAIIPLAELPQHLQY